MIYTITFTNYLNETLEVELQHPEKSGFVVADIAGLGPVQTTVNASDYTTIPGAKVTSTHDEKRQIDFTFQYYEFYEKSIAELRHICYRIFAGGRPITIRFIGDNRDVVIEGYVTKNENQYFNQQCGAVISVICPRPYFKSMDEIEAIFAGIANGFEFPFPYVSEYQVATIDDVDVDKFTIGDIIVTDTRTILYEGDIPTGITVILEISKKIELNDQGVPTSLINPIIKKDSPLGSESMQLNTAMLLTYLHSYHNIDFLNPGDRIEVNTEDGVKTAVLKTVNNQTINIINCFFAPIGWFKLYKGENTFKYNTENNEYGDLLFTIKAPSELYSGL